MGQARNWTQAERDQLSEEWGMYSVGTLAKRLNRSENGIIVMAQRLNLGAHIRSSDLISLNQLFKALGTPHDYSYRRDKLEELGLKVHRRKVKNNSFRMVDIGEFWVFAEKNRHLFDFSRMEENALGAEPDWVKAKRSEDFKRRRSVKPHNAIWTAAEDRELERLLRMYRYTWPEIAERLHRSEGAIQRRVNDLGLKERPIKADNHVRWTDEELNTVSEMIKAGSNYENISRVIGKSAKAIRSRVYNMYLTENLNKVAQLIGNGKWGENRPDRAISQKRLMTTEEKSEVKEQLGKLAGLLAFRIRQHFDDEDNWQRHLCRNWHEVKGCTAGGISCDECDLFERIRPQFCGRCGATFFERQENRICERCRIARKKAGYRKYLRLNGGNNRGRAEDRGTEGCQG